MQSEPSAQALLYAQRGQLFDPPQSVSVSFWFFTVSEQVGGWQMHGGVGHAFITPHAPLEQSPPQLQVRDTSQRGQGPSAARQVVNPPPQSISDSAPFLVTSWQVGSWQMPLRHTPLWQSLEARHIEPSAHFLLSEATQLPPQSVSVSVPFFLLSPQVGAWQERLGPGTARHT
jgi:hypothetical protein